MVRIFEAFTFVCETVIAFDFICSRSGKEYTKSEVATWCRQIVNDINSRVADLNMPRYAHVVQITMMEQTGAGSRSISRCLWDASCDSTVHEIYKSKTMICIVSVYGVYRY